MRDDARSTTWTSVRTFFSSTVALIEPATSAKRVSDVLRDLESGFLVSGQRAEWLEAARARWVARVREIGRTEDAFGDENMTGFLTLLGQLAASLKTESFRVEFMSPVPLVAVSSERSTSTRTMLSRRGISMYGAWRLKLLALLGFDAASEMDPSFEDRFGEDITVQAYGTETDALGFEYPRSRSRFNWESLTFQLGLYSTGSGDDDDEEEEEDEEDEDDDEYASTIDIEQSTMNELSEEVKRLRCRVENAERALNCGICLTSKRDAIIFPCMHAMYCHDCLSKHYAMRNSQNAKKCPCCRAVMTGIMRTFP